MELSVNAGLLLGALAATLTLATFSMKSMFPLRVFALASNACFIAYGYLESLWPVLVLHTCLLPINLKRLSDIRKLTAAIREATETSPISQWLLPHMHPRAFKAGEVLFRKGDTADTMFYIAKGELRVEGLDRRLGPGDLIGEIGLFSPDRKRTQTITCRTDVELYSMTDEMVYRLYYQNPRLGFYFVRLIVGRLQRDVAVAAALQPAG